MASIQRLDVPGYTVERYLGKGKFSTVYKAVRNADGLEVALKVIEVR